jgi:hypothetical protein
MGNKYKSSASIVSVEDAVGKVLAHDITEIRPGQFKGAAFKKGHVVRKEDIAYLKRLGKENLYILHMEEGEVHEDEAALVLAEALAGPGVVFDRSPSEGKISLLSGRAGLFKVNIEALTELNLISDISCSSRHTNSVVAEGEILAGTRAIPLIIEKRLLDKAVSIAESAGGIFSVKEMAHPFTGIIITGSEVYHGLIDDKFAPLIRQKLVSFGCRVREPIFAPDAIDAICKGIRMLVQEKVGLMMVAGGMSVDPDDITRLAIAEAGVENIVYGTPVLPGAMFLYGRIGDIPVLGLPACVLFYKTTVMDLLLPRVLAGEMITRRDLAEMAHGGLCLNCEDCRYPICPFGK